MIRALAACLIWFSASVAHAETEVDVELFLAVDVSRSMSPGELEIQRRGYAEALRSPDVAKAVRSGPIGRIALTYVEWAGEQTVIVPWTLVSGAEDLDAFAGKLSRTESFAMRRTSISRVLDHAVLSIETNAFKGLRRVIDVSGDGPNNLGPPVRAARDRVLAQGLVINGLPLLTGQGLYSSWDIPDLDEYYRRCVTGGPASFVIAVTDWKQFPEAVRTKLVQELVAVPVIRAQFAAEGSADDYDCLVGEKMWQRRRRTFDLP